MGRGAFLRSDTALNWKGVVLGLQRLADLPLHVGGLTALNHQGFAHYLPLGGEVYIYLFGRAALPAWASSIKLPQTLVLNSKRLFANEAQDVGLTTLPSGIRDWDLTVSTPERAIFEVLATLDSSVPGFQHAAELFEGLTVLRPQIINKLLVGCQSIRTKRLFLFMANHYRHQWLKQMETENVSQGSGKIQIVKGGRMDRRFMITVPEEFLVQ